MKLNGWMDDESMLFERENTAWLYVSIITSINVDDMDYGRCEVAIVDGLFAVICPPSYELNA